MIGQTRATRREFVRRSKVAAIAAPLVVPSSILGAEGGAPPSERIGLGFIGLGNRARTHLPMGDRPDVEILAVCDVDPQRRASIPGEQIARYNDFRELLARDDIDAVVISTPDHWKAIHAIESARAGKDIYCEKAISRTIREAQRMREAVRDFGRVFQTGSQQRSDANFRFACEMVRNGRIGQLKTATVSVGYPPADCYLPAEPVPKGFDWDMWLGPAAWRPYHSQIPGSCLTWREFSDFGGGWMTEGGAHSYDIVQWALDADDSGPVEVIPPDGKEVRWLTYRYANGVVLYNDGAMSLGRDAVRFEGTEGRISVGRGFLETEPAGIMREPTGPNEVHLQRSSDHRANWLEALRTRRRPVADIAKGSHSVIVCHLGNLAYRLGRPLKWDPVEEQFVGDDEANRWLDRPRRQPWAL